jgi:hypothetical protein
MAQNKWNRKKQHAASTLDQKLLHQPTNALNKIQFITILILVMNCILLSAFVS